MRLVPSILLILEGLASGVWVAGLLSALPGHSAFTIVLILIRGLVGAVQFMSGWLLLTGRLPAVVLAQGALLAGGVMATLETGFRLVPTNGDPTYRWVLVGTYWLYALGMSWYIGRLAVRRGEA